MNYNFGIKLFKKSAASKASAPKPSLKPNLSRFTNKTEKATTQPVLKGGVGYRKYEGEPLWLPNTTRPIWLDGSLPGDRGLDQLDQNQAQNIAGNIVGSFKPNADELSTKSLQPYSEVFGLQRFRECELIHGRWAMLATLGVIVAESSTGVSWADAGKLELDGARYLNFELPFSIDQLCWIELFAVGGAEFKRNEELDSETRIYPGGAFDPLGLATPGVADIEQVNRLREAEIKHARLAMVAFLGFSVQALAVGEGALGSLAKFAST